MADETRTKTRIYELAEATTLSADMNIPVDTESGGTKRIQMSTLIDENLSTEGKAADAKAVGDALATKVDAVPGKGLSTNDYTTAEKTKLAGIQEGAAAVDSTLSVSGKAADAKKTGDEITQLKQDNSDIKSSIGNIYDGIDVLQNVPVIVGTAVNKSDGNIGTFSGITTWATSDFIPIPEGTSHIFSNFNQGVGGSQTFGFAVYSKADVGSFVIGGQDLSTFIVHDNYKFIRMTNYSANSDHSGLYVKFAIRNSFALTDRFISAITNGENLFDMSDVTTGYLLDNNGIPVSSSNYYYSDFIPVVSGNRYAISETINAASFPNLIMYDDNYQFVGVVNGKTLYVDIPEGVAFVRTNGTLLTLAAQTLKKREKYAIVGKTVACYGDSLTWYDGNAFTWGEHQGEICVGFESYIRNEFSARVFNVGMSGQTTPQICARIIAANNFDLFDYLIIMGGDNDDRLGVPLGALVESNSGTTYNTDTVYGALQAAIELAFSNNPELKIVIMTQPQGWTYRNDALELVEESIPDAYRRVADYYGLPIIDNWKNSMVNFKTRNTYYADPADTINNLYMYHPNNFGWERISQHICDRLKTI